MTNRLAMAALLSITLAACGGPQMGEDLETQSSALKGGGGAGGGGGGGGAVVTPPAPVDPNPLPLTPPAPDIVIRESFGFGPNFVRPASGNGAFRPSFGGLGGFWVEYPGSQSMAWIAAEQTWLLAGCSENPNEMPSPLQTFNGCTVSPWTDQVLRFPDALVPFSGLAGPYQLSADVFPAYLAGSYIAIGFSGSAATSANLQTAGQIWLLVRQAAALDGVDAEYELRAGDATTGTVLASGTMTLQGWNPIAISYDPTAQTVSAVLNGAAIGPFDARGVSPSYTVIEGQGVLDNFVVRAL